MNAGFLLGSLETVSDCELHHTIYFKYFFILLSYSILMCHSTTVNILSIFDVRSNVFQVSIWTFFVVNKTLTVYLTL